MIIKTDCDDKKKIVIIKMLVSSIVNEAVGKVFKFFFFIYKKILHTKKRIKSKKVNKTLSF